MRSNIKTCFTFICRGTSGYKQLWLNAVRAGQQRFIDIQNLEKTLQNALGSSLVEGEFGKEM